MKTFLFWCALLQWLLCSGQCNNIDFEATPSSAYSGANSVNGWYISSGVMTGCAGENWTGGASEFSIATTPVAGFFSSGSLPPSPLGGSQVALLNNSVNNYSKTKISTTFTVTPANNILAFAFAGIFSSPGGCCDGVGLFIKVTPCSGPPFTCGNYTLSPSCGNSGVTYTSSAPASTSWVTKKVDLTPYVGTCVTLEVWCTDNAFGGQLARAAFDARCESMMGPGVNVIAGVSPVSYCSGSNVAQLTAPPGYSSYSWTAASSLAAVPAGQATLAAITVTNPVPGGSYTVTCSNPLVCSSSYVYSLATTQVSIAGMATKPSCAAGSAGTATVFGTGSSLGYNFVWTNSASGVVGTSSVVQGLSPGSYTVTATGAGTLACGTSSLAFSIPAGTVAPGLVTAPYCGSTAFVSGPAGGSNYQWYTGTSAVAGATQSSLTYTSPVNQGLLRLGYTHSGCRDSLLVLLQSVPPGTVASVVSGTGCPGAGGGTAVLHFTPVAGGSAFPAYTVAAAGSTSALQSGTLSANLTATVPNLVFGSAYTVTVFDGACYSGANLTPAPVTPSFNVLPGPVHGVACSGNTVTAFAFLNQPAAQYTFSWSPQTFIGGSHTSQIVQITPSATPGSSGTVVYTVVVTPNSANCPVTATYSINYLSPATPTVSNIPNLCSADTTGFPVQVVPPGGTFSPFTSGIIKPTQLAAGVHTIQYTVHEGSCVAVSSSSFLVQPSPTITITGDSLVCSGSSVVLSAAGANPVTWSNQQTGPSATISPIQQTVLTATGMDPSGCSGSASFTVNVLPLPQVTASGGSTICAGQSIMLSAQGASSYSWNTSHTGPSVTVTPVTTSTYNVTGFDTETGCTGSAQVVVAVDPCTGLQGSALPSATLLYPNPFNDKVWASVEQTCELTICDITGKSVHTQVLVPGTSELELGELAPGIYYAQFREKGQTSVVKLLRQ